MPIDIDDLSEEELLDLNHRIVERLKFLDQARAHFAMMEFRVGERVEFTTREGRVQTGMIAKFNRKTVSVLTDGDRKWKVSPELLRKAGAQSAYTDDSNVIPFKKE